MKIVLLLITTIFLVSCGKKDESKKVVQEVFFTKGDPIALVKDTVLNKGFDRINNDIHELDAFVPSSIFVYHEEGLVKKKDSSSTAESRLNWLKKNQEVQNLYSVKEDEANKYIFSSDKDNFYSYEFEMIDGVLSIKSFVILLN